MPFLLHTTRSALAHAALAHLTPELLAFDADILHSSSLACPLPKELLLIVRTNLISCLSTDLIVESTQSLASHETSLLSLICPDCISYNTDIYGPSVFDWPWDQFSGPCLCQGDVDACLARVDAFTAHLAGLQCDLAQREGYTRRVGAPLTHRAASGEMSVKGELIQFSPMLLDANWFLELGLSRKARRLARLAVRYAKREGRAEWREKGMYRGWDVEALLRVRDIWDAVELVLHRGYGCQALDSEPDLVLSPSNISPYVELHAQVLKSFKRASSTMVSPFQSETLPPYHSMIY